VGGLINKEMKGWSGIDEGWVRELGAEGASSKTKVR